MRAVVCPELGPLETLVVEEQAPPSAGEGQVVVDVRAAGVNFVDGLICQGRYQIKPATPFVPGSEIAGEVSAVGPGVERCLGRRPGHRLRRIRRLRRPGGGAGPLRGTDAGQPRLRPGGRAHPELLDHAVHPDPPDRPGPGEWVLVLGAGGGMGLAAVDVATALGGRVIAAASSPEKLEAARSMGAEATIAYEEEDLKVTGPGALGRWRRRRGRPGGWPPQRAGPAGHPATSVGSASSASPPGPIASVPLNQVLLNNRTVVGVDWGGWTFKDPIGNRDLIAQLMDMVGTGRLHPVEPAAFPLDRRPR